MIFSLILNELMMLISMRFFNGNKTLFISRKYIFIDYLFKCKTHFKNIDYLCK